MSDDKQLMSVEIGIDAGGATTFDYAMSEDSAVVRITVRNNSRETKLCCVSLWGRVTIARRDDDPGDPS